MIGRYRAALQPLGRDLVVRREQRPVLIQTVRTRDEEPIE